MCVGVYGESQCVKYILVCQMESVVYFLVYFSDVFYIVLYISSVYKQCI